MDELIFPIYLDHAATTPLAPEVLETMMPYLTNQYGNPATIYNLGMEANQAVEQSRDILASKLNCFPDEIYFTSGGTEADNWAILGTAMAAPKNKRHILVSSIEHPAILDTALSLKQFGFDIELIPVDAQARIDPMLVASMIREETVLVSVMHANNEVGTIQQIEKIANICRSRAVVFHTDAVQTFCKLPIDLTKLDCDLLSISAHKIYGPKGIGALYIRSSTTISPYQHGGEQEHRMRAGTLNVPGIVGFGSAVLHWDRNGNAEQIRLKQLAELLIDLVIRDVPGVNFTGSTTDRLIGNVHFCFDGVQGETLLLALNDCGIAASSGSACSTGSIKPSHVLLAMGISETVARGAVRMTLGESTTELAIRYVAKKLSEIVKELRNLGRTYRV